MIRKLALSAAFAAAATTSMAADLPGRAPAPAPFVSAPVFTWTGFYVGGQIGGAWTKQRMNEFTPAGAFVGFGNLDTSGVVGGMHIGYNYQFPGSAFVLGGEADLEATSLKKTSNVEFTPAGAVFAGAYTYGTKIGWQGSLRARLGYSFGNALLYTTGGLAFANVKTNYASAGTSAGFSDTRTGWTLGAGMEYAFTRNWTARIEYRYTDFGRFTDPVPVGVAFWGGFNHQHRVQEQAVRVGVSYKF